MLAARIFLLLCAALWLPYGLLCLLNPGLLAASAGVEATSATGFVELLRDVRRAAGSSGRAGRGAVAARSRGPHGRLSHSR
jgi:hypothetical protein